MIKQKALEPLIASILLIVVVVILVTFVLSFGSDFTNKSLTKTETVLDSSKEAVSGLFYLNQVNGNYLQLTNLSKEDYNFTGYTILSTDYNSDYFWINSYRPFETNISFKSGSKALFPLLCMPNSKFKLELQDVSGNKYTTDISPISNSGYTSCNQYHVPLWEFETVSGSYTINTFSKQEGEIVTNGNFDSGNISWNVNSGGWKIENSKAVFFGTNSGIYIQQSIPLIIGKKYRVSFDLDITNGTCTNYISFPGGLSSHTFSGPKSYEYVIKPTESVLSVAFTSTANSDVNVDNVSVIEIDPLPTITSGTKYIEALSTNSALLIPNKQIFGVWEFDFYYGSQSFFIINIVSELNSNINYKLGNGYTILIDSLNRIIFRDNRLGSSSNLFITPNDYIAQNTWYSLKVTRTINGQFTMYIRGGSFGDNWILVSVVNGSNPVLNINHENSNYFFISNVTGDRIANIKITPEIE